MLHFSCRIEIETARWYNTSAPWWISSSAKVKMSEGQDGVESLNRQKKMGSLCSCYKEADASKIFDPDRPKQNWMLGQCAWNMRILLARQRSLHWIKQQWSLAVMIDGRGCWQTKVRQGSSRTEANKVSERRQMTYRVKMGSSVSSAIVVSVDGRALVEHCFPHVPGRLCHCNKAMVTGHRQPPPTQWINSSLSLSFSHLHPTEV